MKRADQLTEPPVVGEFYLVPCYVTPREVTELDYEYKDGELVEMSGNAYEYVTPIINHLHTDRENGQSMAHYHADYRFEPYGINQVNMSGAYHRIFPHDDVHKNKKIEYRVMICRSTAQTGVTPSNMIRRSNLKHKCIHKGKCPHRGYDLSSVVPVNGEITCPLHGLRFNAHTKELLHDPMLEYILSQLEGIKHAIANEVWVDEDGERREDLIKARWEFMSRLAKLYPHEHKKLLERNEEERRQAVIAGSMRDAMLLEPTNFVEVNSNYRKY